MKIPATKLIGTKRKSWLKNICEEPLQRKTALDEL